MARKRKRKDKAIKKDLTSICREITILAARECCQKCGKAVRGKNAHLHHIIPRGRGNALKWDLCNLMLLCMYHHLHWWHKNILEAETWFEASYPEAYKYLWKHKEDIAKFTNEDLENMLEERKEILKQMELT